MKPKLYPPYFFYVMATPHELHTKFRLSKCNFLTRCGLHESYVMSRKSIPSECCTCVVFVKVRVLLLSSSSSSLASIGGFCITSCVHLIMVAQSIKTRNRNNTRKDALANAVEVIKHLCYSQLVWETPGQLQGSKTPKPENPRKKLKNYHPDPDPKLLQKKTQKILKIPENSVFWVILVFFEFFFGNWGRGPGGNFWVFLEDFRVSGFWIPVAGRAFRNSWFGDDFLGDYCLDICPPTNLGGGGGNLVLGHPNGGILQGSVPCDGSGASFWIAFYAFLRCWYLGHFPTAHETTTTAKKPRLSSVPIQPPKP